MSLLQTLFVVYLVLAGFAFWLAFRARKEQKALEEEIEAVEGQLAGVDKG
jgi:preprotein translocase subunit YajC